jgi:DNA-binding transcriptional regulator YhcF (GntR family)
MMIAQKSNLQSIEERLDTLRPLVSNLIQQSKQLGLSRDQTLDYLSEEMKKEDQ